MDGIKIENIKGKFVDYTKLIAESGFCFYDKDQEDRFYLTSITTPITDTQELERKYIVVQGNAEDLNAELEKQRLEESENGNNTNI
jgi:hypothetical protein